MMFRGNKTLGRLATEIAELRAEKSALTFDAEITRLQKEKGELEIELDWIRERHARELREIEHNVRLHREQSEGRNRVVSQGGRAFGARTGARRGT